MSESGSTFIHRLIAGIDSRAGILGTELKPNLQIIRLPASLESTDKPTTVKGEVTEVKPDGTVRILTEKGEIVAKPDRPLSTQEGQSVEVRLPKGSPPQTANLRPAPPETQAKPQQPVDDVQYINIPQTIPVRELAKYDEAIIRTVQVQDIPKIVQPYLEEIKTLLLSLPLQSTTPLPDLTTPLQPLTLQPNQKTPEQFLILAQILPTSETAPSENIGELNLTKPTPVLPHVQNDEDIISGEALTLPIALPLKSILAGLIARPPQEPVLMPKLDILDPQIMLPVQEPFTLAGPVAILAITPPAVSITPEILKPQPVPLPPENEPVTPGLFKSVVSGFTPEKNLPILTIIAPESREGQLFILDIPVRDLPLGTQLDIAPLGKTAEALSPSITSASTLATTLLSMLLPDSWDTLQEIQTVLMQTNPLAARAFHNIIPQAANPQQIAPAALFFLAAMRGGDMSAWLGDKIIDAIKRAGKSDLLSRLERDISGLSRLTSEPSSGEWKTTGMPVSFQNDIHKIMIHYKNDGRDTEQNDKNKGGSTRFLMNLNLTNIGPLQLDGLFQGQKDGTGKLDIILRTKTAFSAPMQTEMQSVYKSALAETRFTGELSFQNKPEQWVHIAPQHTAFSQKI